MSSNSPTGVIEYVNSIQVSFCWVREIPISWSEAAHLKIFFFIKQQCKTSIVIRLDDSLLLISLPVYTLCSKKSDAKIQITITMAHLTRINYPLSSFNYHLSGTNVANFNKIHLMVSEQQLIKKWNSKNRSFQYGKYRLAYLLQEVLRIMT